jgi:hypothetical protein
MELTIYLIVVPQSEPMRQTGVTGQDARLTPARHEQADRASASAVGRNRPKLHRTAPRLRRQFARSPVRGREFRERNQFW